MRAATLVLLALAAAPAAAQDLPVALLEISVSEPTAMVRPLQGAVSVGGTTRVSCALADTPSGGALHYAIESAPSWSQVVVSPATDSFALDACESGYVTREFTVTVTASEQAPALRASPIVVGARSHNEARDEHATDTFNVTAAFFSVLDVQAAEAVSIVAPGDEAAFPVHIENFGNAATLVAFSLENKSDALEVTLPSVVALESRQQGGKATTGDVVIRARAAPAEGFVNDVHTFTVQITSVHEAAPTEKGDETTLSFVVTRKGGSVAGGLRETPGTAAMVGAAALVGAALAMRSRRS